MTDILKKLDSAMTILTELFQETRQTEIADALDILSEWREEYVQQNSQFGAGA